MAIGVALFKLSSEAQQFLTLKSHLMVPITLEITINPLPARLARINRIRNPRELMHQVKFLKPKRAPKENPMTVAQVRYHPQAIILWKCQFL